ncbi:MAG: universal stress protein [Deltaproteobacteria bacterium]|nr:universal stress protein [Deltaproteobacteria bacterium]
MGAYKTILVGTEFSPVCEVGLSATKVLAEKLGARRVHVVHVAAELPDFLPPVPSPGMEVAIARTLELLKERLDALAIDIPNTEVTRELRRGLPARELSIVASDVRADLIVIASHGRGALGRFLYGSVGSKLVRIAHVPVFVARMDKQLDPSFPRVLAAVDLSPVSSHVLEHAFNLAGDDGIVHVLSAFEPPIVTMEKDDLFPRYLSGSELAAVERARTEALEELVKQAGGATRRHQIDVVRKAPPPNVVLEVAEITSPDLIVLGTSGRSALGRMILGSTATRVLAEAHAPVLVVPYDAQA